jgi:hypothetical protein
MDVFSAVVSFLVAASRLLLAENTSTSTFIRKPEAATAV